MGVTGVVVNFHLHVALFITSTALRPAVFISLLQASFYLRSLVIFFLLPGTSVISCLHLFSSQARSISFISLLSF